MIKLIVKENDSNQTLINYLKKIFKGEPLSKIYHLFYNKKIKVNDKIINDFKFIIKNNDVILIYDNKLVLFIKKTINNPNISPIVAYEDENILIVIKDHGVVCHSPTVQSLDNIVRYYLLQKESKLFNSPTFTISHQYRLDKLTKGLIIYPKSKIVQQILNKAQDNKNIIKKYLVICEGKLTDTQNIKGFIFKDEKNQKMVFSKNKVDNSKECQTIVRSLAFINGLSLLECQLITGRKHQIRATLEYLKLPIIGDKKYGSKILLENKIMLFAYYLKFINLSYPLNYLNQKEITLKFLEKKLIEMMKKSFV